MAKPDAKASVQKEWDRLLAKNTWKMPKTWQDVEYYDQVVRDSKRTGRAIHLGRLFDICVLKGSELPEGHPNRKWKGRVVFGGNNVQDEHGLAATFPDAGSGASYASASKLLDTVARLPGCLGEQSDAPAAYTQADMYEEDIEDNDTPTYVQLPEWQWNDAMREAHRRTGRRPVCRLLRSLYGHPSAGLFWERKYKMILRDIDDVGALEAELAHSTQKRAEAIVHERDAEASMPSRASSREMSFLFRRTGTSFFGRTSSTRSKSTSGRSLDAQPTSVAVESSISEA